MNKKILGLLVTAVAVFALNGCGSSSDTVIVDPLPPEPELATLFLVDINGVGIDSVPYTCYAPDDSIVSDAVTPMNGEFLLFRVIAVNLIFLVFQMMFLNHFISQILMGLVKKIFHITVLMILMYQLPV